MAQSDIIKRHYAIIHFLQIRKKAKFEEIREYLRERFPEFNFSKRTFLRDVQEMASVYDIDIECDRKNEYTYSINTSGRTEDMAKYMMEVFNVFSAFNLAGNLLDWVQPEIRRPKGVNLLYPLLEAIKNKFQIHFSYEKFVVSRADYRIVYPLGLKESIGRWYLLAYCVDCKDLRAFALDRITELAVTPYHFTYKHPVSFQEIYSHCFGITTVDKGKLPEEVILQFTSLKGKYIKSYPLHPTQVVLEDNTNGLTIRLKIHITYDFILELLKHTGDVSIIQPETLKTKYIEFLNKGLEMNR